MGVQKLFCFFGSADLACIKHLNQLIKIFIFDLSNQCIHRIQTQQFQLPLGGKAVRSKNITVERSGLFAYAHRRPNQSAVLYNIGQHTHQFGGIGVQF